MKYFAYGSNMSIARLRQRVPSAVSRGIFMLRCHDLRWHKFGRDGSAKCDAFFTAKDEDFIYGVVFEINPAEKPYLDMAEGLGNGYDQKDIQVIDASNNVIDTFTYVATNINASLRPFSWYVNHVLVGAYEASLPEHYLKQKLTSIDSIEDPDHQRDCKERSIHL